MLKLTISSMKGKTHPNLFHYFADLRFKAHVQHAVGFIQHKVGATTQIGFTTLQEINETAWSSDANLHSFNKNNDSDQ